MAVPKVFISYSWDGAEHQGWVQNLAARLREHGVETILDVWSVAPGEELPGFMETSVRESDFVLVICTPKYKTRADKREGGVGYEGTIMTGEVFNKTPRKKFIPILRHSKWSEAAPSWLLATRYISLEKYPGDEDNYHDLLDTLHDRRPSAPPIGTPPERPRPVHDHPEPPVVSPPAGSTSGVLTRFGLKGQPPPSTPKTDHDRIQELKTAGRMPILVLNWGNRQWDQPAGTVKFNMNVRNLGSVAVTDFNYRREGITPFVKLADVLPPSAGTSFSFTMNLPQKRGRLTESLVFRYSSEVGARLEEVHDVTFDPALMGVNSDKGVSINLRGQRVVSDIGVGDQAEMRSHVLRFRDERLAKIAAGETPVPMKSETSKVVMHVVPFTAVETGATTDTDAWSESYTPPMGVTGCNRGPRSSAGLLKVSGDSGREQSAYLQIFWSGAIETTLSYRKRVAAGYIYINAWGIEDVIIDALKQYLPVFQQQGVEPPFLISIALLGVKNATLLSSPLRDIREGDCVIDSDTLLLPDTTIRSYDEALHTVMRPAFNSLWQALGISKSLCYDKEGNWNAKDFRW